VRHDEIVKYTMACPKCQASEVVRVPGGARGYGAGNYLQIGATIFGTVPVSRYVCLNCGFVEEWVDSAAELAKVRKKYARSTR
jgi:transposase-like protein